MLKVSWTNIFYSMGLQNVQFLFLFFGPEVHELANFDTLSQDWSILKKK